MTFPGNIRELQNIIERGVCHGKLQHYPAGESDLRRAKFDVDITDSGMDLNAELDKIEKMIIEKALQKAKGSKKKAADLLNIYVRLAEASHRKLGVEQS